MNNTLVSMKDLLRVCLLLCLVTGASGPTGVIAQSNDAFLHPEDVEEIEDLGARFAEGVNASTADERIEAAADVYALDAVEQHGIERLAGMFERLAGDFGTVEYHHSELAEVDLGDRISRILHVYVRSTRQDQWKDIQLRIEPDPPYRILQLGFLATVAEPVYLPNGDITDSGTLRWLNGYVDDLIEEEDLSGSILIAEGDKILFERAFGQADAEGTRPVTDQTRFNLGSGNKMFTALAVARLVEAGEINFDTTIDRFFPDFPESDHAAATTIHHLLSHTSGIGEYWTPAYEEAWNEIDGMEDMLPYVYRAGTTFEPGTRWEYSNSNFVLLGLIIEQVTGEDYFSHIRNVIFEPLGMTQTGSFRSDGTVSRLAQPLVRQESGWAPADIPLRGSSAGGGYSTARDMHRFARGLAAGRVVDTETLRTMTTRKNDGLGSPIAYGYGFILSQDGDHRSFGHGGTASGINFEFRFFPDRDMTLVVFSNQDNGAYDSLRENAVNLISGAR